MSETITETPLVSPLLDNRDVVAYLKVSEATYSRWRPDRKGPPFLRMGGITRHHPDAVVAWLASLSASEYG